MKDQTSPGMNHLRAPLYQHRREACRQQRDCHRTGLLCHRCHWGVRVPRLLALMATLLVRRPVMSFLQVST